ncbi:MAG: hypothetical protein Q3971_06790 [Moraxella sp.]|nr:hypothetical protein [Moraxella sp.]
MRGWSKGKDKNDKLGRWQAMAVASHPIRQARCHQAKTQALCTEHGDFSIN